MYETNRIDQVPTAAELAVLEAIVAGAGNTTKISIATGIPRHTVDWYLRRLRAKTDTETTLAMVVAALKKGWVEL